MKVRKSAIPPARPSPVLLDIAGVALEDCSRRAQGALEQLHAKWAAKGQRALEEQWRSTRKPKDNKNQFRTQKREKLPPGPYAKLRLSAQHLVDGFGRGDQDAIVARAPGSPDLHTQTRRDARTVLLLQPRSPTAATLWE